MKDLAVDSFLALDGVAQGPGGPDEDRENGFEQGGWVGAFFEEELGRFVTESTLGAEALLLGRKTYDTFAASWRRRDRGAFALARSRDGPEIAADCLRHLRRHLEGQFNRTANQEA